MHIHVHTHIHTNAGVSGGPAGAKANLRTKIVDFRGLDSIPILKFEGWNSQVHGEFPQKFGVDDSYFVDLTAAMRRRVKTR